MLYETRMIINGQNLSKLDCCPKTRVWRFANKAQTVIYENRLKKNSWQENNLGKATQQPFKVSAVHWAEVRTLG